MILIIDSGATKCEFLFFSKGKEHYRYVTVGMNINYLSDEDIRRNLEQSCHEIPACHLNNVKFLFFYAAGCGREESRRRMELLLHSIFSEPKISVFSDLTGACHALCGKKRGWVAILGTGSSSCLYNGEQIEEASPSLGYLLGDEGSGTCLGKSFLKVYLSGDLPGELKKDFEEKYQLNHGKVLENVYRNPYPNRFMASIVPFISDYLDYPVVAALAEDSFQGFIKKELDFYQDRIKDLPLHMAGSVAFHYKKVIQRVTERYQVELGKVICSPIEGLVHYYEYLDR